MKRKDVIKNALREKLMSLSKEELIDIVSELSALYIISHSLRRDNYPMGVAECGSELRTDLMDIINATEQGMPVYKPSILESKQMVRGLKEKV